MSFDFGTMSDVKYNIRPSPTLEIGVDYIITRFSKRKGYNSYYYYCRLLNKNTNEEFGTRFNIYQATDLGLFKSKDDSCHIPFRVTSKRQNHRGYIDLTFELVPRKINGN